MQISAEKPYKVFVDSPRDWSDLEDSNFGLCLACGSDHYHCEPDAACYLCEDCGAKTVFGTIHLLFNNRVVFASQDLED